MQRLRGPVKSLIVYLVPVGAINRKSPAIRTGHRARARRVARPRAERAQLADPLFANAGQAACASAHARRQALHCCALAGLTRPKTCRAPRWHARRATDGRLARLVDVYRERERFETTWLGKPQGPALSAL